MALSRPFRLGGKEVFLPNFTLTLIRTPKLPPTFASFIVPINLNKLDIRDYLFHVYNIRIHSVRSYIQQEKVRQDKPGAIKPKQRRWYRPRARKLMTVELERPFAWPEEPVNFDPWDQKTYDAAQEHQSEQGKRMDPRNVKLSPNVERESIATQAKRILQGEDQWESRTDLPDRSIEWEDVEEAREVEADIVLPKD